MSQRQCFYLPNTDLQAVLDHLDDVRSNIPSQRVLLVSQQTITGINSCSHKQAQHQLGKEFSLIIFDASEGFQPDSFGAIVGTLTAGGALIILAPNSESSYVQRLQKVAALYCEKNSHFYWCDDLSSLAQLSIPEIKPQNSTLVLTEDQQQVVHAVEKVVSGHRRRPLLITSDRGRGKTASMGAAAAELLKKGKRKLIVTAPSLQTVDTFFHHAALALGEQAEVGGGYLSYQQGQILFYSPDSLIEALPESDCVFVDEAAALPNVMLLKLVGHYSRLVFATTLHGYEGTGRGFAIRFQKQLDQLAPGWNSIELSTPFRWDKDDQLEHFTFDALLMNAEPVDAEQIEYADLQKLEFEKVFSQSLVNNDDDLRHLFGLLVLAHYRTRPSDLQMMLDQQDISIYVLRFQSRIIATAMLVEEGKLSAELSQAVYNGTRRVKGHLLPQSLLAQAGVKQAGALSYQRIIRIAVHPTVQRRGFGEYLLQKIVAGSQSDILGTSFSMSDDLMLFWQKVGFTPARIGLHHDEVSGVHSLMMLRAQNEQGETLLASVVKRFSQQWPFLLDKQLADLSAEQVIVLSQSLTYKQPLSSWLLDEVQAFAYHQRSYDNSRFSLHQWALSVIITDKIQILSTVEKQLLVGLLLQQNDIQPMCKQLDITGKKQLQQLLRQIVTKLLAA
jgi:tRNA(Met) cytidine acetyltransferase